MFEHDAGLLTGARSSTTIGIDMGGTFVDCVVVRPGAALVEAKTPTTRDPVPAIMASLEAAADAAGTPLRVLLGETGAIVHGTTVGLNALLDRTAGRVGLLATRGHEDAVLIGRVHQKVAGLRPHEITRVADLRKPAPLVPRWDIRGIDERIDAAGNVLVELDEAGVVEAADELFAAGCEALVVAFLWSHLRPDHERRAAGLIEARHPGLPVVRSSEVAPVIGEYERTAAAIVNAALLPRLAGYLERLGDALHGAGFGGRLWVMGMTGGVIAADVAALRPVETLRSGPVGGIVAAGRIGRRLDRAELIATDMGGTSFDVGLLVDGGPQEADVTVVGQFHIAMPTVDVRSIGAGGGSIAWLDEVGGLHVGPQSAGASPGPACYGRGGTAPTVTDADLVLGRLDREAVLGGTIRLDAGAAERVLAPLAARLGVGLEETAAGIVRVADAQIADLIRTVTVERGHDPRDFTLVAYGGAGPVHVGRYAADIGVREAVVPRSASVFSALGLAGADHRRTYKRSQRMRLPLDADQVAPVVAELRRQAEADLAASCLDADLAVTGWVDVRYRRQTHQLRVPVPLDRKGMMTVASLGSDFETLYARTFGAGTGYTAAGLEATALGLHAEAARTTNGTNGRASWQGDPPPAGPDAAGPAPRYRPVWFDGWTDSAVVRAVELPAGARVEGPAVIDWGGTTIVVHPGQHVIVDDDGNARLRFAEAPA